MCSESVYLEYGKEDVLDGYAHDDRLEQTKPERSNMCRLIYVRRTENSDHYNLNTTTRIHYHFLFFTSNLIL